MRMSMPAYSPAATRYNTEMTDPIRTHDPVSAALIDRARLAARLSAATREWSIEVVEETGSTNTDLRDRLRSERTLAAPLVRVAYLQHAGRGRRGRQWVAAAGDALMFSVAYPLARPLQALGGLSLAVGTAILEGLRTLAPAEAARFALKWPNDILLDRAKLGGILIETAASTASDCMLVIGVGINLRGAQALADQLGSVSVAGVPATRIAALDQIGGIDGAATMTDALAAVLNALATMLERFEQDGFGAFRARWQADHAYAGEVVSLIEHGVELAYGIADSVDEQGQLLLACADGTSHVCAVGDVSLRLRPSAAPPHESMPAITDGAIR